MTDNEPSAAALAVSPEIHQKINEAWGKPQRRSPDEAVEYAIALALDAFAAQAVKAKPSYQRRVGDWMAACFTPEICADKIERNHRFLEEALELVQSLGCTASEAHQLVDYTFGRPQGDTNQEVGGVVVTLAALCLASDLDMIAAGETELTRIWTKIDQIRAKQAGKPKHSPLPEAAEHAKPSASDLERAKALRVRASIIHRLYAVTTTWCSRMTK